MTSPILNPGQTIYIDVEASAANSSVLQARPVVSIFNEDDETFNEGADLSTLEPGERKTLEWEVPDVNGLPVNSVGVEIAPGTAQAKLHIHSVDWSGAPNIKLTRHRGQMWHRAWVNAVWQYHHYFESFRLIQNTGTGMLLYGPRDWEDYRVSADVTPHLVKRVGIAARVQGLRRYYALVMTEHNKLQLIRELDGTRVLNETNFELKLGTKYQFELAVEGDRLTAFIDGTEALTANDSELESGGIGLLLDEGRSATHEVCVAPLS